MVALKITAEEATKISASVIGIQSVEAMIIEAANEGREFIEYKGRIRPDISQALLANRFDVRWDSECNTTWVCWG